MILFLYGEDTYRSHEELLRLKERFFGKFGADASRHEFDAEEADFSFAKFSGACGGGGLFSEKKFIVLKYPFLALSSTQEKIVQFLQEHKNIVIDSDTVLVVWDAKPDKRSKLFKFLKKNAKQEKEFVPLQGAAVSRWIREKLHVLDPQKSVEAPALGLLAGEVGSDLYRAENELQKLVAFIDDRKNITEEDVRMCVASSVKEDVFQALDAVGGGNKTRALELMERQIQKGENPIYLLTMCAYHVRNMLLVAEQADLGNRDASSIARVVKIHPFVAQKLLASIGANALSKALKMFQLLGRLDIAVKTGKMDGKMAVEEFILHS